MAKVEIELGFKGLENNSKEFKAFIDGLNNEFKGLSDNVKEIQNGINGFTKVSKKGFQSLGDNVKGAQTEVVKFTDVSKNSFKTLKSINFSAGIIAFNQALEIGIKTVRAFRSAFDGTIKQFRNFETAQVGVEKTTNLSTQEIDKLGKSFQTLSENIPVSTNELLEIAQAAGQLGVQGAENIENFTEVIARLGRSTDVSGSEAATSLARILKVSGESTASINVLAAQVVALGNAFEASESEIINVTNQVARGAGVFGVSSGEAAALAVALRSMGVRAELAGSTVTRSFNQINDAIRTGGKELDILVQLTGKSGDELKKAFTDDAIGVFKDFVEGLSLLKDQGEVNNVLREFGLNNISIAQVLPALSKNIGSFNDALEVTAKQSKNATALLDESNRAFQTGESRAKLLSNALSNLGTDIGKELNPALDQIVLGITDVIKEFRAAIPVFNKLDISTSFDSGTKSIRELTKELGEGLLNLLPGLIRGFGFIAQGVESLKTVFVGLEIVIKKIRVLFLEIGDAIIDGLTKPFIEVLRIISLFDKDLSKASVEGIGLLRKNIKSANKSLDKSKASFKKLAKEVNASGDSYETAALKTELFLKTLKVQRAETDAADEANLNLNKSLEEIAKVQNQATDGLVKYSDATQSATRGVINLKVQTEAEKKSLASLKTQVNLVAVSLQKFRDSEDPAATAARSFQAQAEVLGKALQAGIIDAEKAAKGISDLQLKFAKETNLAISAEDEKRRKEKLALDIAAEKERAESLRGIVQGANLVGEVVKGAQGAANLISKGIGDLADQAIKGLGGPVSAIVNVLGQGPKFTKEVVQGFVTGFKTFLANIADSISVLIEQIILGIPDVVIALAKAGPAIIQSLIRGIPTFISAIIKSLKDLTINLNLNLGSSDSPSNAIKAIEDEITAIEKEANKLRTDNLIAEIKKRREQGETLVKETNSRRVDLEKQLNSLLSEFRKQEQTDRLDTLNQTLSQAENILKSAVSSRENIEKELNAAIDQLQKQQQAATLKTLSSNLDAQKKLLSSQQSEVVKLQQNLDDLLKAQVDAGQTEKEQLLADATARETSIVSNLQSELLTLQRTQGDLQTELFKETEESKRATIIDSLNQTNDDIKNANALLLTAQAEFNAQDEAIRAELGIEKAATLDEQIALARTQLSEAQAAEQALLVTHNAALIALEDQQKTNETLITQEKIDLLRTQLMVAQEAEATAQRDQKAALLNIEQEKAGDAVRVTQNKIDQLAELTGEAAVEELNALIRHNSLKIAEDVRLTDLSRQQSKTRLQILEDERKELQRELDEKEAEERNPLTSLSKDFKVQEFIPGGVGVLGPIIGKTAEALKTGFSSIFTGAQDGGEVPQGFPNDTFPAALTSGENVLSSNLSDRLESFLEGQGGGNQGPQNITVVLQVGEKQLADVLIDLNRQGFRTA